MRKTLLCIGLIALGAVVVTPWLSQRGAAAAYAGSVDTHRRMARGMDRFVDGDLDTDAFSTGSELFDGEWLFGTYFMAGMGYLQTARQHEALTAEHVKRAEQCVDMILSKRVRVFDAAKWGEDPLATLDDGDGHAAYLGYLGLLLGVLVDVDPNTRHAELQRLVAAALAARVADSPIGIVETYPHERYPVDNLAVYGAIALSGRDVDVDEFRARFVDRDSGLLVQAIDAKGKRIDHTRGSGTALGAYFASFFDATLARDLYGAIDQQLADRRFGFGTVREYPRGIDGWGDIDSGPIVFGAGLSATGFTLAGARSQGDEDRFTAIWRTARLWGAPVDDGDTIEWVNGGPLGNAIMFAMATAEVSR